MIRVEDLEAGYGEIPVLRDINAHVDPGEVVAVIGSNGAGKTTLLKAIAGLVRPRHGRILHGETRIDGLPAHRIVRRGVAYVPAEREIFSHMTVLENLMLGAYAGRDRKEKASLLRFAYTLFPRLEERARQLAGTLSGGEQQMLAIGRGLMSKPSVLLLDEPTTGLAPMMVAEMYRQLHRLKGEGLTILLAEQQVPMALALADRAYVLESGWIRMEGPSARLLEDPAVKHAYLGVA
ncbi:MAG: ABC transporter ATP-binding protein [Chloroflexota bacterium]|nr:ABC transporter ATP-binding protein [Chloroflexota bacterium]MDE3193984.1 ABC transporter ATP-binding protein [Chloroflexota bacterium]